MTTNPRRRLAALAKNGPALQVRAAADTGADVPELVLYDSIGWFGVTAKDFVEELSGIDAEQVIVRVNSPGGDVYDGLAMYAALQRHPARVTVVIDGLAASAASVVAMAGDEVVIAPHAELLIHDAWGVCVGNATDMKSMAGDLDRISDNLASIYAERAGGDVKDWRKTLKAETWLSATEALDAGLVDRIERREGDSEDDQRDVSALFDLSSIYAFAGRREAPAPQLPSASAAGPTSPASMRGDTNQEGEQDMAFTPDQLNHLRAAVGVPQDADEATIIAAVDEALAEGASEQPANTVTLGMAVIEPDVLAQLRADAELGRQAHEAQARRDRENTVQAAIADGRIAPARRDHWLAQLEADPGAEQVLAALEPGLIPVQEAGHAAEGVLSQTDADYEALFGAGKAGA